MSNQSKPKEIKCNRCSIQGLEWHTIQENGQNKYRLRWVWDKAPHDQDECQKIKNREQGYSFAEIIMKHKNAAPKQQEEQKQETRQPTTGPDTTLRVSEDKKDIIPVAGRNTTPQEYVTREYFESYMNKYQLKIQEFISDFWEQNTRLFNTIQMIQNQYKYIPGFTENMQKDIENTFKKGSDLVVEKKDTSTLLGESKPRIQPYQSKEEEEQDKIEVQNMK